MKIARTDKFLMNDGWRKYSFRMLPLRNNEDEWVGNIKVKIYKPEEEKGKIVFASRGKIVINWMPF